MSFFKFSLECDIEEGLITKTDDTDAIVERKKRNEWKIKTMSMRFFMRMFQKYGNPEFLGSDDDKEFCTHIGK